VKIRQFLAGNFGLVGFVLAVVGDLYADNKFESIIQRALLSAMICYVVGYSVGVIGQFIAEEHGKRIADMVARKDLAAEARREAEAAERLQAEADAQEALRSATPPAGVAR
jgi:ERCC4-type nuclease